MKKQLYEVWLAADGKHHNKYAQPQADLEALCAQYNCTVNGTVEDSDSRLEVELTDECKTALIESDLLEQLPVAGDHPGIFEAGTVKTQPEFLSAGLTA